MALTLGIFGASGRMGRAVASCLLNEGKFHLSCAHVHASSPFLGQDLGLLIDQPPLGITLSTTLPTPLPDLFIDFSLAPGLSERLALKRPLVIGTTGLSSADLALIKEAAQSTPIFHAANFSIGMALMTYLVQETAKRFPTAQINLTETHHAGKKDAPSGSALKLAASIRKINPEAAVPIQSIRNGNIVGKHRVQFYTGEERIEIFHEAQTRDAFAKGALLAAEFLSQQKPGLYNMDDLYRS